MSFSCRSSTRDMPRNRVTGPERDTRRDSVTARRGDSPRSRATQGFAPCDTLSLSTVTYSTRPRDVTRPPFRGPSVTGTAWVRGRAFLLEQPPGGRDVATPLPRRLHAYLVAMCPERKAVPAVRGCAVVAVTRRYRKARKHRLSNDNRLPNCGSGILLGLRLRLQR